MSLALCAGAAQAQPTAKPDAGAALRAALELKGDAERGKLAFDECAGCHRKNASGRATGAIPRLSGQHAAVVIKQVSDIRAGRRINPPMKAIVEEAALNAQTLADIAVYLQALPYAGELGKGPGADAARGKALYQKDCESCHGALGDGRADKFIPAVASQHYQYLQRELALIREGARGNSDPEMVKRIKPYSPVELQAVSDHMSRLPPPGK